MHNYSETCFVCGSEAADVYVKMGTMCFRHRDEVAGRVCQAS